MYFRLESTAAKLPEYFLINKHDKLEELLKLNGYVKNKDYNLIYLRGYEMKQTIRFKSSKMRKNEPEVVELIKDFLLTREIYNKSSSSDQMYYNIKKYFKD